MKNLSTKTAPPPSRVVKKTGAAAWRRRFPWLAGALLVALIVAGLWPRAVPVEVAAVTRGPLVVTVDEEGMTRVRNRYVVSAPVAGQLRRIDWKAGAVVEAEKTVLAVLEPSGAEFLDTRTQVQAEARVRGAEAAREAAAAQRERARAAARLTTAEFERARRLRESSVLSPQEFDLAQMRAETATQEVRAAEFALRVAEFELEQARAMLIRGETDQGGVGDSLAITSPVSGRILRVLQESSRVVTAGFPLVEVGDPQDLELRIEVLSRDGVAIAPGAPVWLEQWGGPGALRARVRLVEPAAFTKISALGVEEQRVYVVADFVDPVEKRPTLGDNYRVEARIVIWENPNALRAPAGALFKQAGTWLTFVVESGRARRRAVQVGQTNGVETEILDGVSENSRLVIYPGDKVTDGGRVTPLVVNAR